MDKETRPKIEWNSNPPEKQEDSLRMFPAPHMEYEFIESTRIRFPEDSNKLTDITDLKGNKLFEEAD